MDRNTLHFGAATFNFKKQALFKFISPLDLTYDTSCTGFIISGSQPDNSSRRIIFSIDDQLFFFGSSGLIPYPYHGDFDDIISHGNTVADLLAVSNVPEFVGKKVYPIIALEAPADSLTMPKIKIAVKVNSYNDLFSRYFYSPVYQLTDNARLYKIIADVWTNGHAVCNIECRIKKLTGWTDWQIIELAEGNIATAIQFRANCTLSTLDGSDEVKINSVTCKYTTDADLSTSNAENFFTLPQAYDLDLKTVYALIKHDELLDADIKAFVSLRENFKRRENFIIATATGDSQSIQLPDNNIAQDSLAVFIDGIFFTDFDFDTGDSTITLQADSGAVISASYLYNFQNEIWHEMTCDKSELNQTRFTFHTDDDGYKIFTVKFVCSRKLGNDSANLGTGNLRFQTFALTHNAFNLTCNGVWQYDELSQLLKVFAPLDEPISCQYEWRGFLPNVKAFIVGASVL